MRLSLLAVAEEPLQRARPSRDSAQPARSPGRTDHDAAVLHPAQPIFQREALRPNRSNLGDWLTVIGHGDRLAFTHLADDLREFGLDVYTEYSLPMMKGN